MPIIFEGEPPYESLWIRSGAAVPKPDGVEVTLAVEIDGPNRATVPMPLFLSCEAGVELAQSLELAAKTVRIWERNRS